MDSASVSENGYLDLLLCDIDPVHLFTFSDPKSSGNEGEFFADPEIDTCNYEQFNNMDFLCTVENDESEDELYLSSSARDAYARIAELAEYVLKDQHEKQVEDAFAGNLILDEMALENTEKFTDVKKQKCHKRTFLGSAETCSDTSEPKYKKIVDASAVSTGNGCFLTSLNSHSSDCTPLTHQHMSFSVPTINALGNFVIPGSSVPLIPESLPLGMKDNRENIDSVDPAQQKINYFLGNGQSNAIKYPALTSSTELMVSPGFQVNLNGLEMYKEVQVPVILSEETSRRPRSVEAFCTSLMDYFRDVCKSVSVEREMSLDHMYIDGTLRQSQIETKPGKNSVKSVEKDSVTNSQQGKEKAVLERNQIFQIPGGKELETKVIVVLGKAGMGKSILVQKICQDWSNGEFPQFEFVFWFDCKQISLPEKWYSLKDLLLDFFVKPQEGSTEIFEYLLQNSTKVLLVFDGLEGLHGHENFPHCSASQPNKDLCRMKELLSGLIQKKILNGCTLLLTARTKEKVCQYVSKVDKTIEIVGFSPRQRELYITKYFEGFPSCDNALNLIKECEYLFSHCYSPVMCRFVCFLCEAILEMGDQGLPSTLTTLFLKFVQQKIMPTQTDVTDVTLAQNQENLATLACIAWYLGEKHQSAMKSDLLPSKKVKEFALKNGFFLPFAFPKHSGTGEEEYGTMFSDFVIQNFLGALHLILAEGIKDKSLIKYLSFPSKKKKPYNWLHLVPRFLAGLLFLQDDTYFCSSNNGVKKSTKKQKMLLKYIKRLQINNLCPERLLELLHCIYETQNNYLLQHVALRLKPDLSFLGTVLTPPDVHVLSSTLKRSRKEFSLDLQNSSIDTHGLKDLVGLKNVTSFRASLSDTIKLWKYLEQTKDYELLRVSTEKFVLDPFKAKTMKDISDLSDLVEMQEIIINCVQDASSCSSYEIPAVKNLRKLEFALGPACGLQGFLKLVEILAAFPSLQHLDLDALSENGIGDEGAKSLCEVFPTLTSLETLNLSQNKITDVGAEKLATALPFLSSLTTLSLYNNSICDFGAENLAKVLPAMASLRVLDIQYNKITGVGAQQLTDSLRKCPHIKNLVMWNPTIPYGVLEHLQQLDSRISV
ncbi:MHC class II transactivator isoform X1 [Centrocercus urophasianus]|uniref:MHC class II transactivator isoform X1 n=2 Tax=Centrocercus urophasianus TaxID=9002 RepID=UPI001C64D503|nr:MHC class II transactivator isoform X1 [Centrocercus urophasianus]XP_042683575.1 MHC class II transactivator isoform X1 [Centrocercus urophasianus]XP_042683576.1 MHC class II transactivator isoform X1 [Centrocercus urophasianus]XP_042683577.1 MHC class II transactivator isoform X1 [Centrocercus urophasianus]XP_042683578.1 MHC class II transactivator isoform X1 [Centrocercus urophasianus]XP_042683579.1 MHC class II transactivator isoform X1 [Centrocercus urophasianus]